MKLGIILVGVSGCGKSTVEKQLRTIFSDKKVSTFSLDTCRLDMCSHALYESTSSIIDVSYADAFEYADKHRAEFTSWVNRSWAQALEADVVIVDNTNLTAKARARWVQDLRHKKAHITTIQVMTPLQTVIDRQKTRGDKEVPESVVRDMYMRQQEVLSTETNVLVNVDGTKPLSLTHLKLQILG